MREKYEQELKNLNEKVLELGKLTDASLSKAVAALEKQDLDLAVQVIEGDVEINRLEEDINDMAILLIAKQSPVAVDLRRIIVTIKISSDLERVADFAVNIAKSAIRIGTNEYAISKESLHEMIQLVKKMLSLSLEAFINEDIALARTIASMDDEVDKLYSETIQYFLQLLVSSPDLVLQVSQLSFVARFIERIGDYTTNISEEILYVVKGKRYDLNN
ncbi:phosphate signaling complex protein PhoU [Bacillus sp. Marseille-P3661]|uniref:phosphate signaling complex protein PhoU n=1 Tax=Bacillus sp. Marseille-P3661 TaxID=1936234 RepID=UPI002155183B|nr:phosphate signaling complex protein PhoU [Bacillus sp. Marseille-P3661]